MLRDFPGGVARIPDLATRRAVDEQLAMESADQGMGADGVIRRDLRVPGPEGAPDITLRTYRPVGWSGRLPCIYFIHGGGMIMGSLLTEDAIAAMLCERVGVVVVSVDYRLAPEHPYPAAVDDCFAGLVWTASHADELEVDPDRLAVYGGSAGGGLTLACTLRARDAGGPPIVFQMPIYPMIDDRNDTESSHEVTDVGVWDRVSALEAWDLYLGGADPDAYAAPARAEDLRGLPPTFIDVGEVDMFRDENISFAVRLLQAGVPTELHVYPGAYHASELIAPNAHLSRRIWAARIAALKNALGSES